MIPNKKFITNKKVYQVLVIGDNMENSGIKGRTKIFSYAISNLHGYIGSICIKAADRAVVIEKIEGIFTPQIFNEHF